MKSKAITQSAKGEQCTFNIAGVCNYDPATVVFCHLPFLKSGVGQKASDLCGAYGCSACHDAVDDRVPSFEFKDDPNYYMARALVRTLERLIEKGILSAKGAKA